MTRKRLARVAAALAAVLAVAGCSALGGETSNPGASNPKNLEKPSLSVGTISSVGAVCLHIALQRGFFAEEGLTVNQQNIAGGSIGLDKVIVGDLDVALVNDASAITAQVKKARDLRFIADGPSAAEKSYVLVSAPTSGITTIEQLPGKTIGVSSLDDIITLALKDLLATKQVDASKIKFAQVAYADSKSSLSGEGLAAAVQAEPYYSETLSIGTHSVIDVFEPGSANADMPIAAYTTTADLVNKNPRTVAAFQRAMSKAAKVAEEDRAAVQNTLLTFTKIAPGTAQMMNLPSFASTVDRTRLGRVVSLMKRMGSLTEEFDVGSMIVEMPKN